jgi:hypothetical protein
MYMDYWHAALWVMVEGFEKLGLKDQQLEQLLKRPLRKKLREFVSAPVLSPSGLNRSGRLRRARGSGVGFHFFRAAGGHHGTREQ